MGQKGFFDIAQRYAGLDAKNDPLARIDEVVPWEDFRPRLEAAWRKPTEERKSPAGRKPWDAVVMFKAIVLCELYNLSDDQVEYQLRDRLSFMRFLGLYQRREFLTRGGFPFCYGCDSRLAKEIRHVSMHCSSGRLRQHSASAPGQTLSRSTSGSAAFGLGGGLRRHEPRGSGEGWRHGPSDAERLGASLQ